MRPPSVARSRVRFPLDEILGSRALVRLSRVLIHSLEGPVSVTDAAFAAGLTVAGARRALQGLEQAGLAVRVGSGRAQKFAVKEGSPFIPALSELFELEDRAYSDLLDRLRAAVAIPEVHAAWLVDRSSDSTGTLEVSVVADARAVAWLPQELRTRILAVERESDLIVELGISTRADDPIVPEEAVMLWGFDSLESDHPSGHTTTADANERSLRLSEAVAELIRTDSSLIARARRHTAWLLREGQGMSAADISEWQQLLDSYSPERLRDLLISKTSRADRLRRSSPFLAVLTADEREWVAERSDRNRK